MRGKIVLASLVLVMAGAVAPVKAQSVIANAAVNSMVPTPNELYCSGVVTTEAVPRDSYVITGEESNTKITYEQNDIVYLNKGSDQGVKVGDEYFVVRSVVDPLFPIEWTKWENSILHKMGTVWEDEGRVKVEITRQKVSIARVVHSCNYIQRGDLILPFVERPAPPLKPEDKFDKFAPPNGKALAMIITGKTFQQAVGSQDVVYVNLGNGQGVHVGDYFRIFRYQGTQHETVYQTPRYACDLEQGTAIPSGGVWGFGVVPSKWNWSNVPREDIGEGIVLRTGPNSSTVLITLSLREIYPGDYVELE